MTEIKTRRQRVLLDDTPDEVSALEEICGQLMGLQRIRMFCIRMQSRCDNAVEAYVRTELGFRTDLAKTSREAIVKKSQHLMAIMDRGQLPITGELTSEQIEIIYAIYKNNTIGRDVWDQMRVKQETWMRKLAIQLPVYNWVRSIRGFKELGLAVIVGEVGNIGENRRRPAGVWKRLGLAVMPDGYPQGEVPPNLSKAETKAAWIERGYNPHRRAQVYAFIDDLLVRHQWQNGVALGPYGEHYARKKEEYLTRYAGQTKGKGHADEAARRYMAKMFLRDLWREWCRTTPPLNV